MVITSISFGDGTGFLYGGVPYQGDNNARGKYIRYVGVPVDGEGSVLLTHER